MDTITHTLFGLSLYGAVDKQRMDKNSRKAYLLTAVGASQILILMSSRASGIQKDFIRCGTGDYPFCFPDSGVGSAVFAAVLPAFQSQG